MGVVSLPWSNPELAVCVLSGCLSPYCRGVLQRLRLAAPDALTACILCSSAQSYVRGCLPAEWAQSAESRGLLWLHSTTPGGSAWEITAESHAWSRHVRPPSSRAPREGSVSLSQAHAVGWVHAGRHFDLRSLKGCQGIRTQKFEQPFKKKKMLLYYLKGTYTYTRDFLLYPKASNNLFNPSLFSMLFSKGRTME